MLPGEPQVETLTVDYERAACGVAEEVIPDLDAAGVFLSSSGVHRQERCGAWDAGQVYDRWRVSPPRKNASRPSLPTHRKRGNAFGKVEALCGDDEADLPSYFETTYIGRPCAGRRRPPFFPVEMWNVYGVRRHGETRTNNSSEASHNALPSGFVRFHHLSVFELVEVLVSFEATVAHDVAQVESGATKKQKSKPCATAASKPSSLIITSMPIPRG